MLLGDVIRATCRWKLQCYCSAFVWFFAYDFDVVFGSRYEMGVDVDESVIVDFDKKGEPLVLDIERSEALPRRGRKLRFQEYRSRGVL